MFKVLCITGGASQTAGVVVGAIVAAFSASVFAGETEGGARIASASYRLLAKLPDWSGTWTPSRESGAEVLKMTMNPVYSGAPHLAATYAKLLRKVETGTTQSNHSVALVNDNALQCLPHGMPLMMALPSPIGYEFLFTPGQVTILSEENEIRRIYTDGRPHNASADATYSGDSIGHWQDRTLVVDTVSIKPKAMLMLYAVQSTAQTHVIERIRLKDKSTLEIDTIVEDPVVLTAPWHYRMTFDRSSSGLIEYVCQENNREVGGELNLIPPK